MTEIFVFGSFWFWTLLVAEFLLLFVFVEFENGIGATISMLAFGACLQWLGNIDIIKFVAEHPLSAAGGAVAYFALGACWSAIKWWIYCNNLLTRYNEAKREWMDAHNIEGTILTDAQKVEWQSYINGPYVDKEFRKLPPLVRTHKANIMRWMSWWVISMIWSLINDFVKEIWRAIYKKIAAWFQRIADKVFAGVKDDMPG